MRLTILCGLLAIASSPVTADDTSDSTEGPVRARVVASGATAHSGPGADYAATTELAAGTTVDVYREAPDGWLGIRPPAGDFSWVFARHVDIGDDGSARVNKDGVPARVGIPGDTLRGDIQVRLRRGEEVEVLEEVSDTAGSWLRITPPAGEFRWVQADRLEILTLDSPADDTQPSLSPEDTVELAESAPLANTPSRVLPEPGGWVPARYEMVEDDEQPIVVASDTFPPTHIPTGKRFVAPGLLRSSEQQAAASVEAAPAAPSGQSRQEVSEDRQMKGDITRRLVALDLKLSHTVARDARAWQLESLIAEAEKILADSQTIAEREAAKHTLSKIDRFAAIQRNYRRRSEKEPVATAPITPIAAAPPAVAAPVDLPMPVAPTADALPDTPRFAGPTRSRRPRYDAVGILKPVVSKRPNAPEFALVNSAGRIVSFVTPTPDVDLGPYLGERIGVAGPRRMRRDLGRPHITAGRVGPVGNTMVR